MAKKPNNPIENENIEDRDINVEMEDSSLSYAIKTIVDRALPDVRDGLKPVLRRVLYTMWRKGLMPDKGYTKNADIVGETMGKYHPHGDGSIYGVLVNASQPWNYRYPYVDFQGNNGSYDGDPAAAYRYTEGRLDKRALKVLEDVDKETVDFKPNYAETTQEPVVLPSLFPTLLVNGSSGIATGYTTEIPSHNLTEVIDAIIAQIKNNEITIDELLKYIKGPDFAIGGQLIYNEKIRELYETGRASLNFRATHKIELNEESDNMQIIFNSLPPESNKPKIVEKLYDACMEKKTVPRVLEVRDESEGNEIRIVLELHKTAVPEIVVSEVYNQKLGFAKSKGFIMRALVDQAPRILSLKQMIQYYIEHRRDVVDRRTRYDLTEAKAKLHVEEGFEIIFKHIDEAIAIIRASDTTQDAINGLISRFGLSDIQARAIMDLTLRRLTKLEENKILDKIKDLKDTIAKYENIISSQLEIDKVVTAELRELKKTFGDDRRTQVVLEGEIPGSLTQLNSNEAMVCILTSKGNIKQLTVSALDEMKSGGFLKEKTDVFVQGVECKMADEFVLILETGEYVKCGFNDIVGNLDFTENKKVVALVKLEPNSNKLVHLVTKKGNIIRALMENFKAKRRRVAPLLELQQGGKDAVIGVKISDGDEDNNIITVVTNLGTVHRFYEKGFKPAKGGTGVPCIGTSVIEDGEEIVDFAISKITDDDTSKIILYLQDAQGVGIKTMMVNEFKPKGRVSKGITGTEFRRAPGKVHKIKIITNDFFVIDDKGKIYNQKFVSITPQSRYNKPNDYEFIPMVTDFYLE